MSRRAAVAGNLSRVYQPNEQIGAPFKGGDSLTADRFTQFVERNVDRESQHGSRVHILMENGRKVDKWVELKTLDDRKPWRKNYPMKGLSGL